MICTPSCPARAISSRARPRWILSLSGGGYKGLFTAEFLARLEANLDAPLHEKFDLIAGTSIGSVLALGIALGIPAARLAQLLCEQGGNIFPSSARRFGSLSRLFQAPYDPTPLRSLLASEFGDPTFADL
jgi:patatin-like phospholipase/acyl hydrolase